LLVLAPAAVVYATRAHNAMVQKNKSVVADQMLTSADRLRDTYPELAAQVTLAAYRLDNSEQTREAVLNTFAGPYDSQLAATGTDLRAVAYSPDSSLLALAGAHGIQLLSLAREHQPRQLALIHWNQDPQPFIQDVDTMAFSPDGSLLALGSADGSIRL